MDSALRSRRFEMWPCRRLLAPGAAWLLAVVAWSALALVASPIAAASQLPPAPTTRVSDRAGVLSAAAAASVENKLETFEREQGTQVVVAIFPRLPEGEALEDWTSRVAQAWRVGRAGKDDGAVLFVFVEDRQLRLEVGYGLEGALTDLESRLILERELVPRLQKGDWDGGISATTDAIITAVRGEYKADPRRAVRGGRDDRRPMPLEFLILVVVVILVLRLLGRANRRGRWRSGGWGGGGFPPFGGGGFGGGGFSGGGFSGGGGSFGGGGASGRW